MNHASPYSKPWRLWTRVAGAWGAFLAQWLVPDARAKADVPKDIVAQEITAARINIVDGDGKTRLVISNADRFPDPKVRGVVKERSIKTSAGGA